MSSTNSWDAVMILAALSLTLTAHSGAFESVDARFGEGYVAVVAQVAGIADHFFLLDSGSPFSYIDASMVDGSTVQVSLTIGKERLATTAETADLAMFLRPIAGVKIAGVLGCDFLIKLQLRLDYRQKRLAARVTKTRTEDDIQNHLERAVTIPLTLKGGSYFVEASIGPRKLPMMLDTGANTLLLTKKMLEENGASEVGTESLSTADGMIKMRTFRLEDVTVSGFPIPAKRIFRSPFPDETGILGYWLLAPGRSILDLSGRRVLVERL